MCKVVHCFYYLAQNSHRNHCPAIRLDMGVSPLWFMPPVDSILKVFLDTAVQQDFEVGVLSIVWLPILIQDTTRRGHIDRCDGSNQGVGSMWRLPHHMGHTMEVSILKNLRTHGLFSLGTMVRIIRITVQEVQDTTRVNQSGHQGGCALSGRSARGGSGVTWALYFGWSRASALLWASSLSGVAVCRQANS